MILQKKVFGIDNESDYRIAWLFGAEWILGEASIHTALLQLYTSLDERRHASHEMTCESLAFAVALFGMHVYSVLLGAEYTAMPCLPGSKKRSTIHPCILEFSWQCRLR